MFVEFIPTSIPTIKDHMLSVVLRYSASAGRLLLVLAMSGYSPELPSLPHPSLVSVSLYLLSSSEEELSSRWQQDPRISKTPLRTTCSILFYVSRFCIRDQPLGA
ncbi:hypothetical protein L798_01489 [Zootermopsis nevadensis]|uniref:Uncharacterized protein n=1 Tax=Zootermopsis nevadensis TaxID=136037 RepID=A0A067QKV7_ZOONE|nr:hypothetical protein L798_01489 [Zootermopsis nevadensis]